MDAFLARLGAQAMNMAIRSGIALTSTYAVQQCSRLLKSVDDKSLRAELKSLQRELNERIKIISPAIDLIEFRSGRGNVFLETAVPLAKSLRQRIIALGKKLEDAAGSEEAAAERAGAEPRTSELQSMELRHIINEMKRLLTRIERDAQMLQFAINASGETFSASLPPGVSPSRLLQASTFLIIGDTQFANEPGRPTQIGPSFTLSLYMLFVGHSSGPADSQRTKANSISSDLIRADWGSADQQEKPYGFEESERKPLWQEVMHKARVRLCRVPAGWRFDRKHGYLPSTTSSLISPSDSDRYTPSLIANEYSYHLEIVEDLDDGRLHEWDGTNHHSFDDIPIAGIRESIPVHQLSKIFYTDTGRILNLGIGGDADSSPALLLKRDINAPTPNEIIEDLMRASEETASDADEEGSATEDTQQDVDSQLRRENSVHGQGVDDPSASPSPASWSFPRHLDPEWLAFEVFIEDEDDSSSVTADDDSDGEVDTRITTPKKDGTEKRSSLDSKLIAQIRNISLKSSPALSVASPTPSPRALEKATNPESFVARSPFGAITSSLSLMEMLIRLTSLQEFQQMSHLSIPDHILTFFLEETSTTGLHGEERWKARNEAKRKVGFDPYADSPTK